MMLEKKPRKKKQPIDIDVIKKKINNKNELENRNFEYFFG